MSFILDALKKSEGERQRQSGPALFEVRIAPPKTRVPLWAAIVGALLVLNLAIVAWLVLRRPAPTAEVAATAPQGERASVPASPPAPAPAPAVAAEYAPPPVATAPATPGRADEPADPPLLAEEPALDPEAESAVEDPAALETPRPRSRVVRGTGLGIPTYGQLGAQPGPGLPELRLDLHVYAERPADRFVFVNNRRLREGESLPDGTRVESIVPEGVVLFARNQRFLLQRE